MRIKLMDIEATEASSGYTTIHELEVELPNGRVLNVYASAIGGDHLEGTVVEVLNSSGHLLANWDDQSLR
jgi:hypothetical protein